MDQVKHVARIKAADGMGLLEQKEGRGRWPATHDAWTPKPDGDPSGGLSGQSASRGTHPTLLDSSTSCFCLGHLHFWLEVHAPGPASPTARSSGHLLATSLMSLKMGR